MKSAFTLSEVAKIDRRTASDEERDRLPYVGLEDIDKEVGRFSREFKRKPETMLATKFCFTPKHILYGKLRPYLNKVALPNFHGVCTTEILPVLPDERKVNRRYLYALLLSPNFVKWASANVSGANLPRINPERLAEYRLALPPLDEQKRIAALLDKADHLRRSRRYIQELSNSFLQSVFLEMFGDPVTNPMGWEVTELGSLLQNIDSGWSPNCDAARTRRDQWAVLRLSAVTYGIYKPEENKRLPAGVCPRPELEVKRGDVLFTRKNTYDLVGACAFVHATPPNLMLPDTIFRFRVTPQSNLTGEYLFGLLNNKSYKRQVQLLASGTAGSMPNISKEKLLELRLPLPAQSAQSKFKAAVERYERICNQQAEASRQAEHLFQTLLHRAFSGSC